MRIIKKIFSDNLYRFAEQVTLTEFLFALLFSANNIFLFATSSFMFIPIQILHSAMFSWFFFRDEKIPLMWYCNFFIAPITIIFLEFKIVYSLYYSIIDFYKREKYYKIEKVNKRNLFADALKKAQLPPPEIKKEEVGVSFRNYLEENNDEYRELRKDYNSLLKKLEQKNEEIIKLKNKYDTE